MTEIDCIFKVSIITVVYNNAHELQATIDSVIAQTYSNIEYIVVDGGSTDNTVDVIKSNAVGIDYWISERDAGIYDAMNKGVGFATGDYIIFMNAGDTFYTNKALTRIFSLLNNEQPDVIMASYNVHSAIRRNGIRKCKPLTDLWRGMVTCHQAVIFKKNYNITHSLNVGFAADYNLIVNMYINGANFKLYPDVILANYAGGGVSDVNQHDVYLSWFRIAKLLDVSKAKLYSYYTLMYVRSLCRFHLLKIFGRSLK
ncbi:glycosyltransferase family 2 protein [Aeromonas veronii]|uniref:glycosyltransferase family 2 protein n=1 Tax=Aeromonas veronii TaxID=654 RepID=UPI003D217E48